MKQYFNGARLLAPQKWNKKEQSRELNGQTKLSYCCRFGFALFSCFASSLESSSFGEQEEQTQDYCLAEAPNLPPSNWERRVCVCVRPM